MIQTGRNPFARETVRKRKVKGKCRWCGNSHNGKSWQYYVDADSPRNSVDIQGVFCDIGCLRAYHY